MFWVTIVCVVLWFRVTTGVPLSDEEQSRIIGGVEAPKAYAPYMAALIFGDIVPRFMCGGSIISTNLVLTAAHCIDDLLLPDGQLMPSFRLRVGTNQWNYGGNVVQVKKYHKHPQWDSRYIKYDAGILVLEQVLVLNAYVAVVKLEFDYVGGNEESLVTGWGRIGPRIGDEVIELSPIPDELQLLRVNTISYEQCQRQLSEVAGEHWAPHIQRDVEICTFYSHGIGMCVGDSGSALIQQDTGLQLGIVSWGWGCAQGAPDVFVRLYGVRQFVETLMEVYRDSQKCI